MESDSLVVPSKKFYDENDEYNLRLEFALRYIYSLSRDKIKNEMFFRNKFDPEYIYMYLDGKLEGPYRINDEYELDLDNSYKLIFDDSRLELSYGFYTGIRLKKTYGLYIVDGAISERYLDCLRNIDLMFNTCRKAARYLSGFVSQGRGPIYCRHKKITAQKDIIERLVSCVLPLSVFKHTSLDDSAQKIIASYM
jgi:hypothetical protein